MLSALLCGLSLLTAACGPEAISPAVSQSATRSGRVLVLRNLSSEDSVAVAAAYVQARGIPAANVVSIRVPPEDNVPYPVYASAILEPVRKAVRGREPAIDFLVLTKGVPLRLENDHGYSLDAALMVDAHPSRVERPLEPMRMPEVVDGKVSLRPEDLKAVTNPYFGSREPFESAKYGMYLASRLDGYTREDAIGLVRRSLEARPETGLFLFDTHPGKRDPAQDAAVSAYEVLVARGFRCELERTDGFAARAGLMGYVSWGSNDPSFTLAAYRSLRFKPGAAAETFVSTSARTFRRVQGGQSLIADLVSQGVTGAKGYVSEPFSFALARADVLFERYTSGLGLVESLWAASPLLKWKDVVIGDPLCSPYPRAVKPPSR